LETRDKVEEIAKDVRAIRDILQGADGICVRLSVAERSNEATQKELQDHKSNHWQFTSFIVGVVGVIVGLFEWLRPK
jgi:hypothetical protein